MSMGPSVLLSHGEAIDRSERGCVDEVIALRRTTNPVGEMRQYRRLAQA